MNNLCRLAYTLSIFTDYLFTDYIFKFEDNSICIELNKDQLSSIDIAELQHDGWLYNEQLKVWSFQLTQGE